MIKITLAQATVRPDEYTEAVLAARAAAAEAFRTAASAALAAARYHERAAHEAPNPESRTAHITAAGHWRNSAIQAMRSRRTFS